MFATGIIFWGLVLYFVLWLIAELIWASITTASWLRFVCRAARLRGASRYPTVLKLASLYLNNWPIFFGFRKGGLVYRESNGVWEGVGHWKVHPPTSPFDASHALPFHTGNASPNVATKDLSTSK
ncbi:hypothetical protein PQH03_28620 [Ralstonia insidiosa]|nr:MULTISPECIES: hypothetical protein [Ralstonia]MBX3769548.1 hypothetical protein [Ralstonia pickettii]MBX3772939.1 hypothetical protein [Ralstonia pickettii]MBX3779904.1 hypothetical protein [Ralstonia pickettii]MBX3808178.1 hypothetical protein [Ralstonia pickettii]MBX3811731.1 hypothetical protein [Ralstonia pickettii]